MADNTKDPNKGGNRPPESPAQKRPHATIDLKAKEIDVKPLPNTTATDPAKAVTSSANAPDKPADKAQSAPPAAETIRSGPDHDHKSSDAKPGPSSSATAAKPAQTSPPPPAAQRSGGGVLSHLAAGIIGGIVAFAGAHLALPNLGIKVPGLQGDTSAVEQRLAQLEKSLQDKADSASLDKRLNDTEGRIAEAQSTAASAGSAIAKLENADGEIKSALEQIKTSSGAADTTGRLTKLEERLALLSAEGESNPAAGTIPQLAALTGKVGDLETSIDTKVTAARNALSKEIADSIATVAAASETAKSGTQRLDRELAATSEETARLGERVQALKSETERLSEGLKIAGEKTGKLESSLDGLKSSTAKPQDIETALAPVTAKIAGLEDNVANVVKSEGDRKANAERIVLALELANLKRALDRGQPYAAEFEGVQKVAHGEVDLAPLAKYKDTGVLPLAELSREFRTVANAAIDAEVQPADASVIDKLWSGAKSAVRIRKVDHNADDKSAEAVVARMEVALRDGRLGEFMEQQRQLTPKAQAATRDFTSKVEARYTADRVIASLEGKLKASLGSTDPAEPKTN